MNFSLILLKGAALIASYELILSEADHPSVPLLKQTQWQQEHLRAAASSDRHVSSRVGCVSITPRVVRKPQYCNEKLLMETAKLWKNVSNMAKPLMRWLFTDQYRGSVSRKSVLETFFYFFPRHLHVTSSLQVKMIPCCLDREGDGIFF